ncbi:MAG: GTP 3',8-cyclase MoaA [Nevskiales bacterium]|nr:GTP 3',8-cyclase MoaA [Nevskiales bacterium]
MNPSVLSPVQTGALRDRFDRTKRKLRLSLTDRCNLRCLYCMPEHPRWLPRTELLTQEELTRVARLFVGALGLAQIRLTGGEPLLRPDVLECVSALQTLRPLGLQRLSMTSNGVRLSRLAAPLKSAGLDDLNVSLDARTPETFTALTRGRVDPVLEGIAAARAAGLPVKVNCVLIRGYNEHEILPLTEWAVAEGLTLRFIEFMPLDGSNQWTPERVVREDEILAALATRYSVERVPRGHDPATEYLLDGRRLIGIISTISAPFCAQCDRVRLTATGELYPCLFSRQGVALREPLRTGADDDALRARIRRAVWDKDAGYAARPGYVERSISMHRLGG